MAGAVAAPQPPAPLYREPSPAPSADLDSRRTSLVSASAASFHTAHSMQSHSQSQLSVNSVASSASGHTVGKKDKRDGEGVMANGLKPLHLLSQGGGGQDVRVLRVSAEMVEIRASEQADVLLRGDSAVMVQDELPPAAGPPPPSPPPSVERDVDEASTIQIPRSSSPKLGFSRSEPVPAAQPSTVRMSFDSPRKRPFGSAIQIPSSGPSINSNINDVIHKRASTETKMSTRTVTGTTGSASPQLHFDEHYTTPVTSEKSGPPASTSTVGFAPFPTPSGAPSTKGSHASMDGSGYLQPPRTSSHRPARRNTTGSAAATLSSHPSRHLANAHAQYQGTSPSGQGQHPRALDDSDVFTASHGHALGGGFSELDPDILMQADQIRRERQAKRRQQEEREAEIIALKKETSKDDNKVAVGNLIGEDHVNYVLMYNMLTGIRIGVSRCTAKMKRPLTDEDFTARHKYSFDIVGNELTPSARYDFKFKDYAPWVFRELREDYFGLDPADYLLSLTAKYILSELGSPGKSGSFFYFSRDYRFIIKTIHHTEHKFLRSILKEYYNHVKNNPHTLLSRFYGLHRVKLPRGRKIHFVIMNNLFPPHKDVHETYDLKGSTVGREYPEEKAKQNPRATLKDLNWINRGKSLELGPEKRALLTEQLRRDSELLKRLKVMDYSLLVGIHNMRRGNRDNVRSNTLKIFSPNVPPPIKRKPTALKGSSPEAIATRNAVRGSAPKRLDVQHAVDLPEEDNSERQQFIFYQDEGGLQATDEQNRSLDTIYYLGIIDILTPYTVLKRAEHLWKGLSADRHKISPVPPDEYANRFFSFMKAIMRGGGGGQRFKAE